MPAPFRVPALAPLRLLAALAAAVAIGSCDDATAPSGPGVPAQLQVVSGGGQSATVGAALAEPLVVRVTDAKGKPVANQIINFRVTSGGGSVFAGAATTNAEGEARERWTVGTVARDSQRVEARAVDAATGQPLVFATFSAVATPDVPAAVVPVGEVPPVGVGEVVMIAARVTDRFGNAVPAAPVVWNVAGGGGQVTPAQGSTDSTGVAQAQWTLGLRLDSAQVAMAWASSSLSAQFTAQVGVPSTAMLVNLSGNAQSVPAGDSLPQPLVARLQTTSGLPIRGAAVTWSASTGTLTAAQTVTDAQGEVRARWQPGTGVGIRAATAAVGNTTSASFTAEVTAAAPAAVTPAGTVPSSGPAGEPLPLAVRVTDRFGNVVAGTQVAWSVERGGGAVSPPQAATDAAGESRAAWTLGARLDSAQVVVARLSPTLFASFSALAGLPVDTRLVQVSGDAQTAAAGDSFPEPLVVRLQTADGQPLRGATVAWTGSAGTLAAVQTVTDARGEARASWQPGSVVGARVVTVTTDGASPVAFTARVTAAAPAAITPTGTVPTTGEVGGVVVLATRVTDRFGNGVPGAAVAWSVSGGGTVSPAQATADSAGVSRVQWTLGSRVDAPQGAVARVSPTLFASFGVAVGPPPVVQVVAVSGNAQTVPAGDSLPEPLVARVQTAGGVPIHGATVRWRTSSGTLDTLQTTDAAGEARTRWKPGTAAGPKEATASSGASTPVSFTARVVPGAAARLDKLGGDGQSAVTGAALAQPLQVAVRDAYGNFVVGQSVQWTVEAGGGTVTSTTNPTDVSGYARASWTLGTGTQRAAAAVGTLTPVEFTATAFGVNDVRMCSPAPGSVVGNAVLLTACERFVTLTGTVAGRTFSFLDNERAGMQASASLLGLAPGPHVFTFEGRTPTGVIKMGSVTYVYDPNPVVSVESPVEQAVARPSLRLRASCRDNGPSGCVSFQARIVETGTVVATGTSEIDATVSLAHFDGQTIRVEFTGRDAAGRTGVRTRSVLVEASPGWTDAGSPGGRVLDADAGRILYLEGDTMGSPLRIASRSGGAAQTVFQQGGHRASYGFLAPRGAVFVEESSTSSLDRSVRSWRDGALQTLGSPNGSLTLRVAGGWAIWSQGTRLRRMDLQSGAVVDVSTNAGNTDNDVAANGDVAFWDSSYDVFRFRSGAAQRLTSTADPRWNVYPLTDGTNVVFRKSNDPAGDRIVLIGPDGAEVPLTSPSPITPYPERHYAVRDGWVAFVRDGQVWLRSPADALTQVTFGAGSTIRGLGPGGALVVATGNRRFAIRPGGSLVDIGRDRGRALWIDGTLHVILGASLFRIDY